MKKLAQIFLSEKRGSYRSSGYEKRATFNSTEYLDDVATSFGALKGFNDEYLAGNSAKELAADCLCYILLLPVTGELVIQGVTESEIKLQIGQAFITNMAGGSSLNIINPYPDDAINFIQIQVNLVGASTNHFARVLTFDDRNYHHQFTCINDEIDDMQLPFSLHIGRFAGREDSLFRLGRNFTACFCFVLGGAFEVENRLLQPRDGLSLTTTAEVEFESLSQDAVMLILELN
ncbi:hypothetical protein GS399_08560 [Pedobacter sp. HMF7647]|uniref:Quercetin 2,3-dioxygenase C-terminal cupin domain-containing protein n=1 Tax=Hufsiella arboris TaxID=2695275 RepID=A0A7K1Y8V4_9SPHI|nr:hypothetical protein [Hufsiella arboris]MXV51022.1 hypothetical protein [Hufsiella arboris]